MVPGPTPPITLEGPDDDHIHHRQPDDPDPRHPAPRNHGAAERKALVEQVALAALHRRPVPRGARRRARSPGAGASAGATSSSRVVFYAVAGHGITVGFHRYFTHGSFKAKRPLRIALAVAGSLAIEGPVIRWVADHRRHHKFSDEEGDPHSPWRYGDDVPGADQGPVLRAHRLAVRRRADRPAAVRARPARRQGHRRASPGCSRASSRSSLLAARRCIGGLLIAGPGRARSPRSSGPAWSASALLHHVTWSINSICHAFGDAAVQVTADRSGNVWWLAILVDGRVVAQPAPRRPDLRPARRRCRARSTPAPGSSGSSRSSAGRTTCAGRSRSASTRAGAA